MSRRVFQKTAGKATREVPHRGVLRPKDFAEDFTFYRHAVGDTLRLYVAYIWVVSWDLPARVTRLSPSLLPDPQINVFFSADGAGVQGVFKTKRLYAASGKGKVAGITFRPGGFHAFWPHSAAKITDKNVSITHIFPKIDDAYVAVLLRMPDKSICARLETRLTSRLPLPHDPNIELVQSILSFIAEDDTPQTVTTIARIFSKSERTLQHLFRTYAGVGLKWVLLRNRLLAATEKTLRADKPDWAQIALSLDYNSQAHFITDFKRVTGMTPNEYLQATN